MNRRVLAVLLVVSVAVAGVAPLVAATTTTAEGDDIAPGQRLAAAVGSQGTDLRSEVAVRVLDTRLQRAESNASKAAVLSETVASIRDRVNELEAAQERLAAAYENGSISFGQYAAESAKLVARERALNRLLNASASAAKGLPDAVREAHGVNAEALAELRAAARNASGQVIAEIARELAGPPFDPKNQSAEGQGVGDGASQVGITQASQAVQRAERAVATADRSVEGDNEDLEAARTALSEARDALQAARAAADAGEIDRAEELAAEARDLAEEAQRLAKQARKGETGPPE